MFAGDKKRTKYDCALELIARGFYVFPLVSDAKTPLPHPSKEHVPFRERAFNDAGNVSTLFTDPVFDISHSYNIGIATDLFCDPSTGVKEALVVVDVDNIDTYNRLKTEGKDFRETLVSQTPRGGYHLIYKSRTPIDQGAGILGEGIDIRSKGGYIVGPGSTIEGKEYRFVNDVEIAECPEWILSVSREKRNSPPIEEIPNSVAFKDDQWVSLCGASAGERADKSYRNACILKDRGLSFQDAVVQMEKWNEKLCTPPLESHELIHQVRSAYQYSQNKEIGSQTPEVKFKEVSEKADAEVKKEESEHSERDKDNTHKNDIDDKIQKFNKHYAYALEGGSGTILWEHHGDVERIHVPSFHEYFSDENVEYVSNGRVKREQFTKLWLRHPDCRKYSKVEFLPGEKTTNGTYNLWRGFILPSAGKGKGMDGLKAWREHIFENICDQNEAHARWLEGFFAHMIQKPQEKPNIALALHGGRGVGKDSLVDRVGHLLGRHYIMVTDPRYISGQFNGHFEQTLFMVLNEAFWSGDKRLEGTLKHLITGRELVIERKGKEPKICKSYTRFCILGNEKWIVPAAFDERRFAVFNVGDKRKQDIEFFTNMRLDMEKGGYRELYNYLNSFDLGTVNLNIAPQTKGLSEQKIYQSDPISSWWFNCLCMGEILGSYNQFSSNWPSEIKCTEMRTFYSNDSKEEGIRSRLGDQQAFGKKLNFLTNGILVRKRKRSAGNRVFVYEIPPLAECRKLWEEVTNTKGHNPWDEEIEGNTKLEF